MEPCDTDRSCNLDASIFKGIFVRNLRYLLDVTEDRARVKLYRRFLATNIASLRHNASCEPQPHRNHTCHIVYLDGAPSYPATGAATTTPSIGDMLLYRSHIRHCVDWTLQGIPAHPADLGPGPPGGGVGGWGEVQGAGVLL